MSTLQYKYTICLFTSVRGQARRGVLQSGRRTDPAAQYKARRIPAQQDKQPVPRERAQRVQDQVVYIGTAVERKLAQFDEQGYAEPGRSALPPAVGPRPKQRRKQAQGHKNPDIAKKLTTR